MKKLNYIIFSLVTFLVFPVVISAATIQASLKPSLQADLTNTLKLQAGYGNPTFTRATTATVQDWEGVIRPAKSGEARFTGARRVENLVDTSETPSGGTAVTITPNALPRPLAGYLSAALCVPTAASALHRMGTGNARSSSQGPNTTTWYVAVVKAAGYSKVGIREQVTDGTEVAFDLSSGTILYETYPSTTNGLATITPKGNGWYQIAVRKTNQGNVSPLMNLVILPNSYTTGGITGVWTGDGVSGVYVTGLQLEDQTGQSNINPSEYVSVGVMPAPLYHGAGVDGVKYFNTLNGNTVASNVVTEAKGGKITSSVVGASTLTTDAAGPLGYLAEGARTNLQTYSDIFAFGQGGGVASGGSAAQVTAVTPYGTTPSTVVQFSANVQYGEYDTGPGFAVVSGTTYTWSFWAKSISGNTNISYIFHETGGTPVYTIADFTVTSSWQRYSFTRTVGGGNTTMTLGLGDRNASGPFAVLQFFGSQFEQASFASSYIPTTSGTVTRNIDLLLYQKTNNLNVATGSAYMEVTPTWGTSGPGTSPRFLAPYNSPTALEFLGTNPSGITAEMYNTSDGGSAVSAAYTPGVMKRVGSKWGGGTWKPFAAGVGGAGSVYTLTSDSATTLVIGGSTNNGQDSSYTNIRNVKIWPKILTDAQLVTMTSTNSTQARSVISQAAVNPPTKTGLVGHWKLDEGTGIKANDSSASVNSGTLVGGPTWTTGKLGKALNFNGSSQYINAGTQSVTGSFALSCWVKTNTITVYQRCVEKGMYSNGWLLGITNLGKADFTVGDGATYRQRAGLTTLDTNKWYHITGVYDSSVQKMYIYLNGVLDNTPLDITGYVIANPSNSVQIGAELSASYLFNGSIDDVRIYNRTVSVAEIAALYKTGATVINAGTNNSLTNGLVGLWSFDGKDVNWGSNTAFDRSGQGNNGTFNLMSTTSSPVKGKIGQGMYFDSVDDYVSVNNSVSLQPLTGNWSVGFWINRKGLGTGDFPEVIGSRPWLTGVDKGWAVSLSTADTKMSAHYADGTVGFDVPAQRSASVVPLNTWQHWVVVFDRTNSKLNFYLNGQLDVQNSVAFPSGTIDQADNIYIGREIGGGNNRRLNAILDDVRVYNRALSATEAKQMYNLGK